MLDKQHPRRRASQPLITSRSNQETLPRPSSFLLAGLKSWTKRTKNETMTRRKGRRDSNTNSTRRVSADSDEDIDDNVVEILSIPTKHSKDYNNSGDETDDADMSSGKASLVWKRFAPKAKTEASNATVIEKPGNRQFVISSAWLDQWLQYVRVDSASDATASSSQVSGQHKTRHSKKYRMTRPPRPGPVTNYILLDFVNGELIPKHNLQRSRGNHGGGDYHVVSQEVWMTFLELYGGGPSIQVPLTDSRN
ncbi:Peptidase C19, ubiquitin-specific peptidase, DUSP domain [Phytophthora cactorum]|nr:Peptidase C19, ubiquitin-specific peptidase, DUSP domain [Phytophthora cactorum]